MIRSLPIVSTVSSCPGGAIITILSTAWLPIFLANSQLWSLIFILIAFDMFTGVVAAIKGNGKNGCHLKSAIAAAGLFKKVMFVIALALATILFQSHPISISIDIILWLYAATEFLSSMENLGKIFPEDSFLGFLFTWCRRKVNRIKETMLDSIDTSEKPVDDIDTSQERVENVVPPIIPEKKDEGS